MLIFDVVCVIYTTNFIDDVILIYKIAGIHGIVPLLNLSHLKFPWVHECQTRESVNDITLTVFIKDGHL